MGKVGPANEPLLERLIYATSTGGIKAIVCDTNGNLIVTFLTGQTVAVTQANAALLLATVNIAANQNIQARGYGYLSSAWYKQPLVIGMSGVLSEVVSNTALPSGDSNQFHSAVPANTLWHVTHASFSYWGTLPTQIGLYGTVGGIPCYINVWLKAMMTSNITIGYHLDLWLQASDQLYWHIETATLNDDFYGFIMGHTMLKEA